MEPWATAVYDCHKEHESRKGQRHTNSPFSALVVQSKAGTGIEDNGGRATFVVEDGDDGKRICFGFSVYSAQVSPDSVGDCCTSSYSPIAETTSAFDNIPPSHTSYRDIRNSPRKYRPLACP